MCPATLRNDYATSRIKIIVGRSSLPLLMFQTRTTLPRCHSFKRKTQTETQQVGLVSVATTVAASTIMQLCHSARHKRNQHNQCDHLIQCSFNGTIPSLKQTGHEKAPTDTHRQTLSAASCSCSLLHSAPYSSRTINNAEQLLLFCVASLRQKPNKNKKKTFKGLVGSDWHFLSPLNAT